MTMLIDDTTLGQIVDSFKPSIEDQYEYDQLAERVRDACQQAHDMAMAKADEWKDAVIDACVVDWVLCKEHETDPRRAINDLLAWVHKCALDPAISKEARDLVQRAEQAEQDRDWLRAALKKTYRLLTDVPAMRLMDSEFYRTVPDSFVNEIADVLVATAPRETP